MTRCSLVALLASCSAALLLASCNSGPAPAKGEALTLVYLRTGPAKDLSKEKQQEVFAGHFANMNRLASEQKLLVAGPFGVKKSAPDLRGVFVLATGDRAEAKGWAETDPGVQAGVFVLEYHDLVTDAPLRAFLAAEMRRNEELKAAGKTEKPGEFGRGYALLIAEDGAKARAALAAHPAVLLLADHDGSGAFAVLDAKDGAAAEAAIASVAPQLGAHRVEDWFASKGLEQLPKLR